MYYKASFQLHVWWLPELLVDRWGAVKDDYDWDNSSDSADEEDDASEDEDVGVGAERPAGNSLRPADVDQALLAGKRMN